MRSSISTVSVVQLLPIIRKSSTDDDNDRRNDNYDGDLGNLDNNDDKNE